jgi:hypothetical protein
MEVGTAVAERGGAERPKLSARSRPRSPSSGPVHLVAFAPPTAEREPPWPDLRVGRHPCSRCRVPLVPAPAGFSTHFHVWGSSGALGVLSDEKGVRRVRGAVLSSLDFDQASIGESDKYGSCECTYLPRMRCCFGVSTAVTDACFLITALHRHCPSSTYLATSSLPPLPPNFNLIHQLETTQASPCHRNHESVSNHTGDFALCLGPPHLRVSPRSLLSI